MNTPLSSFTALVKFQFDRSGLTSEIAAVRRQLQGLTGSQERAARQREQSAVRSFVSEMRMQRTHAKALRENEAFDEKRRKAKEKHDNKVARDRTAAALKSQRLAERSLAAEQRAQDRATREHQRQVTQRANEEIRQMRRVRTASGGAGGGSRSGGGGNTNPWHIGTMAGGLGGLITRGNLAAVGAGTGLQQMYTTANFTAAREPIYEFLTGTKEGGAKQIKYVNDLVDELHLDLIATDKSYTQFLGAVNSSIGADKAQKTFKTIQSFGVMMGANPESLQRGTKAIQQMLSKQKLSAEELTGFSLAGSS